MIVKNLLAVGVIASMATVASAADEAKANWKIKGKIRMDAVQSTKETKKGDADKSTTKSSSMDLKRAQFTLIGEQNGDTMTLKYYAEKNELNEAHIQHKLTDTISAKFGKMPLMAFSWEYDYSSTDQYITSMAGSTFASIGRPNAAQIDASFGDHKVSLQAAQGLTSTTSAAAISIADTTTKATTTDFNNGGGLTAGLQYRGEINKMIRPIVSYTKVKTSGTKGSDLGDYSNGYADLMGLGVQLDTMGLVADVEFDTAKINKRKDNDVLKDDKDTSIQSIILQAKYAIGATSPFLKITSDSKKMGKDSNVGDVTGMQMALGVEHMLDATCRLHAVYTSNAQSEKAAGDKTNKVTTAGFNLGVTASM